MAKISWISSVFILHSACKHLFSIWLNSVCLYLLLQRLNWGFLRLPSIGILKYFSFNSIVSDFIQRLACKQDLGPSLSSWARSSNWLFAQLFGAWRMKRKLNAHFKPLGYLRKLSRSIFIFFPILFNGIFKKTLASSPLSCLFSLLRFNKRKEIMLKIELISN